MTHVSRSPIHCNFSALARLGLAPLLAMLLVIRAQPGWAVAGPAPQAAGPQYVVQAGDTLYDIALRFGVTVDALLAANTGLAADSLAVGQSLVIPGFEGVSGFLLTHTLDAGETIDSLALRLGLQRETLVRLNRLVNPERLYLNQSVVIVDVPDAGAPVPTGTTRALARGEGLLATAARLGQNPWALAAANRMATPGALPPAALVVVPGGDRPTRALPWPLLDLSVGPLPVAQGETLAVALASAEPVTAGGSLGPWSLGFGIDAADPSRQYALQGIHRLAEPDLYPLVVVVTGTTGVPVSFGQPVGVRAADYGADRPLTVDPATIDPAVTGPENEQVEALVQPFTPEKRWSGIFVWPSAGALRSYFGSLRSYNGGPYDAFHGGVDFAGAEDQAITAPATGIVAFTGALTVRGNATLIDHGWGVYTGYWHQSSILVSAGDRVEPGQVIGFNGSTGRVTGPHLHWEVWVGGVQVDGLDWLERAYP